MVQRKIHSYTLSLVDFLNKMSNKDDTEMLALSPSSSNVEPPASPPPSSDPVPDKQDNTHDTKPEDTQNQGNMRDSSDKVHAFFTDPLSSRGAFYYGLFMVCTPV